MADRDGPQTDPLIEAVAQRLREWTPLSARVEEEVLARLRRPVPTEPAVVVPRARRLTIALSPLGSLALAASLLAVFATGVLVGRRSVAPPSDVAHASRVALPSGDRKVETVQFVLRTSANSAVALVGDFNNWDPRATPLRRDADGRWSVDVPLRPGRYRYTFIVDGDHWLPDPTAPRAIEDDFGAPTSVVTIANR